VRASVENRWSAIFQKFINCNGITEGLGAGCTNGTPVPPGAPPAQEGCNGCPCRSGV
jgi:hypothetical protein